IPILTGARQDRNPNLQRGSVDRPCGRLLGSWVAARPMNSLPISEEIHMLRCICPALRCRAGWMAALLALTLAAPARSQTLSDGMEPLKQKQRDLRVLITALFKGDNALDPNVPQHLEAVDTAAKLVTYPLVLDVLDDAP